MRVKELIEMLNSVDPELRVAYETEHYGVFGIEKFYIKDIYEERVLLSQNGCC